MVERAGLEALLAPRLAELHAFCYWMTASYDEAGPLYDATLAEARRTRSTVEDAVSFRVWLYRIASAVCLEHLAGVHRKPVEAGLPRPPSPARTPVSVVTVPWLQPYPDAPIGEIVGQVAEGTPSPRRAKARAGARRAMELAYVAAAQHATPRGRAAMLGREVFRLTSPHLGDMLGVARGSANSVLQRARPTAEAYLARRPGAWAPATGASDRDAAAVRGYAEAFERADAERLAAVVRRDVRSGYQPGAGGNTTDRPIRFQGSDILVLALVPAFRGPERREFRTRLTGANGRPAVGLYARRAGRTGRFAAFGVAVLDVADGLVEEVAVFPPPVHRSLGLPASVSS